VSFSWSNH